MIDLERLPWGKAIPYTSPTGKETVLYGIGMLAEALGRKPQTIRKWEISGIIPSTPFKQGGKRMYSKEHIECIVRNAEKYHLTMGKPISKHFSKRVYKEFKEINDEFFKKEEEE